MKGKSGFFLLIVLFGIAALIFGNNDIVVNGDNVTILYTPSIGNITFNSSVVSFKVGSGEVIDGLDVGVLGMRVGETKNLTLPPSMAYGNYNESRVYGIPVKLFTEKNQPIPPIGTEVKLNGLDGRIINIINKTIVIDTNPLLAGRYVNFTIKLLKVNK